jgi:osmotically-inducible protein OsmY
MAHDLFEVDIDLPEADRQLLTQIRKILWEYEPLRATRPVLTVSVHEGLVHLQGRVRTSAIKEIAELVVLRVPQVRAVRNDLIADPEIVRAVADAFAADPEIGPLCPIVEARDGVVILIGQVPSDDLARRVIDLATAVPLVASIDHHLRVVPPAPVQSANGSTNGAVAVAATDGQDGQAAT